jgi:hypothetical protein
MSGRDDPKSNRRAVLPNPDTQKNRVPAEPGISQQDSPLNQIIAPEYSGYRCQLPRYVFYHSYPIPFLFASLYAFLLPPKLTSTFNCGQATIFFDRSIRKNLRILSFLAYSFMIFHEQDFYLAIAILAIPENFFETGSGNNLLFYE